MPERIGATTRFRFRREQRLRTPAHFERLRAVEPRYRAARRWLLVAMRVEGVGEPAADRASSPAAPAAGTEKGAGAVRVRFGITVGKRNARHAVQRSLVKRIVREAMRHSAPRLEMAARGRTVDLVLRLKAPFPKPESMSLPVFKRALRAEADQSLATMCERLS